MSAEFFAQPEDAKTELCWTTPESNRGYSAQGREKVSQLTDLDAVEQVRSAAPDLKESFEIGRDNEPGHPNLWPNEEAGSGRAEMKGFKEDMVRFHALCQNLHVEVMRAIAIGMGLDEDFFDSFVNVGDNTLRLLHYPEVQADVFKINPGQVRAGEHSVGCSLLLAVFLLRRGTRRHAWLYLDTRIIDRYLRITAPSPSYSRITGVVFKSGARQAISSMPLP